MKKVNFLKKIMTTTILMVVLLLCSCGKNEIEELSPATDKYFSAPPIAIVFSPLRTISSNCNSGSGLCNIQLNANADYYELTLNQPFKEQDGKWLMKVEINSQVNHLESFLEVSENYTIPSDISTLLGYETIILIAGNYPLEYRNGVQTLFIQSIDPIEL